MKRFVDWNEYDALADKVAKGVAQHQPDMVVGIARGGLPLAVHLSHALGCRHFGVVYATKTTSDEAFEFDDDERISFLGDLLPDGEAHHVLLVDDVVAHGDVFSAAAKLVRKRYGEHCEVRHASLFVDTAQIADGEWAHVLETFEWGEDIDNTSTWIVFPWERRE